MTVLVVCSFIEPTVSVLWQASGKDTIIKPRLSVRIRYFGVPVSQPETKPSAKPKTHQPRCYKVILLNDNYTPQEFVVSVLRKVFRLTTDQASRVMITAHMKGSCVVVVLSKDIAETKAQEANEMGKQEGYPLQFTTEPEE